MAKSEGSMKWLIPMGGLCALIIGLLVSFTALRTYITDGIELPPDDAVEGTIENGDDIASPTGSSFAYARGEVRVPAEIEGQMRMTRIWKGHIGPDKIELKTSDGSTSVTPPADPENWVNVQREEQQYATLEGLALGDVVKNWQKYQSDEHKFTVRLKTLHHGKHIVLGTNQDGTERLWIGTRDEILAENADRRQPVPWFIGPFLVVLGIVMIGFEWVRGLVKKEAPTKKKSLRKG